MESSHPVLFSQTGESQQMCRCTYMCTHTQMDYPELREMTSLSFKRFSIFLQTWNGGMRWRGVGGASADMYDEVGTMMEWRNVTDWCL